MHSENVLESNQRLSTSLIWNLQCKAYCDFGPEAWSQKGVPSYVTSAPYTARCYAEMVVAYLRDCLKPNAVTPIDTSEPFYIFDLGAGTGRFGYLFIKSLKELILPLKEIKFCYVMTDIAEKNISYLQQHSYLQPFVQEGILDFAFFRHDQKEPLKCIHSGEVLNSTHNPLILIANYFFDTIPQDLFRANNNTIEEGKITLSVPTEAQHLKSDNPMIIPHLSYRYTYAPLEGAERYISQFPEMESLFQFYAQNFNNTPFLVPTGAFETINYFSDVSKNRLLLLAGDQGVSSFEQVATAGEPKISKHGTFSVPVNYHALVHFFREKKGMGWFTAMPDTNFVVTACVLGGNRKEFLECDTAFYNVLSYFEPSDYWRLINYTSEWKTPSLECLLLLIKLGNWDPMVFHEWLPSIQGSLSKLSPEVRHHLKLTIYAVWDHFFPISKEEGMFIMNLGVLLYDMQDYTEAMLFFKRALDITGETPALMQNMAACEKMLSPQRHKDHKDKGKRTK